MEIKFTIPNEKLGRIVNALKGLYPIPQIPVDEENPEITKPQFTDNEWAKECVRRWIIKQVSRYENMKAKQEVNILDDNSLVE